MPQQPKQVVKVLLFRWKLNDIKLGAIKDPLLYFSFVKYSGSTVAPVASLATNTSTAERFLLGLLFNFPRVCMVL
jgi:hypothetical protein